MVGFPINVLKAFTTLLLVVVRNTFHAVWQLNATHSLRRLNKNRKVYSNGVQYSALFRILSTLQTVMFTAETRVLLQMLSARYSIQASMNLRYISLDIEYIEKVTKNCRWSWFLYLFLYQLFYVTRRFWDNFYVRRDLDAKYCYTETDMGNI
jgi:hypothetical protein